MMFKGSDGVWGDSRLVPGAPGFGHRFSPAGDPVDPASAPVAPAAFSSRFGIKKVPINLKADDHFSHGELTRIRTWDLYNVNVAL